MLAKTDMHLPLVVSHIDRDDDNDNSSDNIKEINDFKITQPQHRLVVLIAALVIMTTIIGQFIIGTIIGQSLNIKEVLVWVRVDGGDKINLIVFSTYNAVRCGYLFFGLSLFFFFERLARC